MSKVVKKVVSVGKKIIKPASSFVSNPIVGAGLGLLGSYLAGKQSAKYSGKAIDLSKNQLAMANAIYRANMPTYLAFSKLYADIAKGSLNNPLYASLRSGIERQTAIGMNQVNRILARRGLLNSGLLASQLDRLYLNRQRAMSGLLSDLLRQAQGFSSAGVSLGLGQGQYAVGNLIRQYNQLGSTYGRLSQGLGALGGGILSSIWR